MKWTIDRIEDDTAIIETAEDLFIKIPCKALPEDAREGDVLSVTVDEPTTLERKDALKQRLNRLFGNNTQPQEPET